MVAIVISPRLMRPSLWSKLPEDMLELVFARLPVPQLAGLRSLSRSWRTKLSTNCSFKRLCAEVRPSLFALVRSDPQRRKLRFKLFDSTSSLWHNCEYSLAREYLASVCVADGGLVCFVPRCAVPILVCNPLSNDWRELPMQAHVRNNPRMVQLVVDKRAGSYRLILVGNIKGMDHLVAEVYHSERKEWSVMKTGHVFGHVDRRLQSFGSRGDYLGVYDCATRSLCRLNCFAVERINGLARDRVAPFRDSVFVLEVLGAHSVAEFRRCQDMQGLTQVNAIRVPKPGTGGGEAIGSSKVVLLACEGLLLILESIRTFEHDCDSRPPIYRHQMYLHDTARDTWRALPEFGKEENVLVYSTVDPMSEVLMCELDWLAHP